MIVTVQWMQLICPLAADQENDPALWQSLLSLQPRVREFIAVLGLELALDEAEGCAFVCIRNDCFRFSGRLNSRNSPDRA
jgi:hypothetical protein